VSRIGDRAADAPTGPAEAAARNLAAWHDASVRALGLRTRWTSSAWACLEPAPFIYHAAVTFGPSPAEDDLGALAAVEAGWEGRTFTVRDGVAAVDLSARGYRPDPPSPWFVRPPGPPPSRPGPPGLRIERVGDTRGLRAFEVAAIDGFGSGELHGLGPFGVHAPGILDDPAMLAFAGWVGDRVVGVSMGYVAHGVVGVYGVATLPEHRRRGYGTALTWAAVLAEPSLPATLDATPEAAALYRRMGFRDGPRHRLWWHGPVPD
jgi:GNAT superfamily N-acetyltransferase